MDTPNQPQPSKPTNPAMWIVLIVIVLAVAGYGVYAYISDNDNNQIKTNSGINNTNESLTSRITLNRVEDVYVISHEDFSLEIPGNWYTTEITHSGNKNLLFTASNENTSDVLGIRNRDTGLIMDILELNYSGDAESYLDEHPVTRGILVQQSIKKIGSRSGLLREVDSTSVDSMEGSYSVNYFIKVNDSLIEILFLGLTKAGIVSNGTVIEQVVQSFK